MLKATFKFSTSHQLSCRPIIQCCVSALKCYVIHFYHFIMAVFLSPLSLSWKKPSWMILLPQPRSPRPQIMPLMRNWPLLNLLYLDSKCLNIGMKMSNSIFMVCIYIYIYMIFNAINAGAGLGLATPFTCLCLSFLEKDCIYLDADCLYDHIKWETFQTCALTSPLRQTSMEKILCS